MPVNPTLGEVEAKTEVKTAKIGESHVPEGSNMNDP